MKKLLMFLVIVSVLVANMSAAYAEKKSIDFSDYTLDELIQIKADLTEEIARRPGGEKMTLGIGQYRIGEDLPAGVYTFRFVQNGDKDVSRTDYYIYENEAMFRYDVDRYYVGEMPRLKGSLEGEGDTRISLYPGEYLSLYYNGALIDRVGNASVVEHSYEAPAGTGIPTGDYTVGDEIPAGSYKIYFNGQSTARVRVFEDAEEADNIFNEGKQTILNESNPEGTVILDEDNVLRVEYTPIIMTKGGGFSFD